MKKIILASTSPRRKELLSILIGNNFAIVPSRYEEDNTLEITPIELVKKHALGKAKEVAEGLSEGLVISSDTIVVYDGIVIGKPADKEDAINTLKKFSGNIVDVVTGLAVINAETKKEIVEVEIVKVKFKELSEKEIQDYVNTGDPLDKAGSFGIQGKASVFIEKIEGDYFSMPGLPLCKLNKIFNEFGVSIFDYN